MLSKTSITAISEVICSLEESLTFIRLMQSEEQYQDNVNEKRIHRANSELHNAIRLCYALIGRKDDIA